MPELTPAELAQQPGPAALLDAFTALGGEASPAELRLRTSMAPSTVSKWLAALRDAQLVDGPKPRPRLTAEGWAHADRRAVAVAGGRAELDAAIARWPAEPQRAFLRMLVAAVAVRWHLAGQRPQRHPGFVAAGRTGTGKTSMAQFVCRAFGLDAEAHVVYLGGRTAGEVLGRREYSPESGELVFEPSPMLGRPLVVFDEFDKAGREQQRAALLCFQGDTRAVVEETPVELRAVPMLACNTQDRLPIPPEYRRRSVVLDMDPIADLLDELDLALYELDADGGPPRLELDALRPPAARLPADVYRLLRDALRRALTEEGWHLCNVDAVELLALGYAAGADVDDVDLAAVAIAAARDYLTCAETVGETASDWRRELAGLRPGADVDATLQAGQAERVRVEEVRQQRAAAKAREALELVGARQQFAEELRQARPDARTLLPAHRPAAKGLRAQLDHLRDDVLASRSEERLAELRTPADALLTSVRELARRDEQQRAAATAAAALDAAAAREAREAERAQQTDERRRAAEAKREQAAAAKRAKTERAAERKRTSRELDAVRSEARALETLWKRTSGDGALQALRAARAFGQPLLVFEQDAVDALGGGGFARVLGALATASGQGTWRSTLSPRVSFHGSVRACEQLDRWGPSTRAVLAPALQRLHEAEDRLQRDAGRKPRQGRPRLQGA